MSAKARLVALLAVGGLSVLAVAWALAGWPTVSRNDGAAEQAARIARGAELYAVHCAACHGVNLEGQPNWQSRNADGSLRAPPHDDTGHTWHHPDGMLFDYTKLGGQETLRRLGVTDVVSGMPAFAETLTDAEIHDVLAFIKTSWSDRTRHYQAELTQADRASRK